MTGLASTIILLAIVPKADKVNNHSLPLQTLKPGREPGRASPPRAHECPEGTCLDERIQREQKEALFYLSKKHPGVPAVPLPACRWHWDGACWPCTVPALRHLLDILDFIQQVQNMLMFNSFNPQLRAHRCSATASCMKADSLLPATEQFPSWVSAKSCQTKPTVWFVFFTITAVREWSLVLTATQSPEANLYAEF